MLIVLYLLYYILLPVWLAVRLRKAIVLQVPLSGRASITTLGAVAAITMIPTLQYVAIYVGYPVSAFGDSDAGALAVAALVAHGHPLYHPLAGPDAYQLLYGPLAFLPYAALFKLGGGLVLAKLLCTLLVVAALAILVRHLVRIVPDRSAMALVGLAMTLYVVPQLPNLIQTKGDAVVFLAAAVPLLTRNSRLQDVVIGICAAIASAAKLPTAIAFLPLLAAMWPHTPALRTLLRSGLAFAATSAAVYCAVGAPMLDWLTLIHLASHHPIGLALVAGSLVSIALPAGLWLWLLRGTRWTPEDFGLLVAGGVMVAVSAKVGAGAYHVAAVMPALLARQCDLARNGTKGFQLQRVDAGAAILFSVLMAVGFVAGIKKVYHEALIASAAAEQATAAYPGLPKPFSIAPSSDGLEGTDGWLVAGSVLAGGDAPFTVAALEDYMLAGVSLPPGVADNLLNCQRTWLTLTGLDEQWGARSGYWKSWHLGTRGEGVVSGSVFDAEFRQRFHAKFSRVGTAGPFDVWRCAGQ